MFISHMVKNTNPHILYSKKTNKFVLVKIKNIRFLIYHSYDKMEITLALKFLTSFLQFFAQYQKWFLIEGAQSCRSSLLLDFAA